MNLLTGKVATHRDYVVSEYAENEEAMIRTSRHKLVYITGQRERQDGYTTGKPSPGRTILLFDLQTDPDEVKNLAGKPEHEATRKQLLTLLAGHLKKTARLPDHVAVDGDILERIDFMLRPRDVE
jgi:hypothetical protein